MSEIEESARFEALGPIRVRIGDSEITVSARRDRIMLAVLLLHAPDPVPLSQLVDAIWDDQPPHNSRNQVQACVSRWRKRFADAGAQRQVIVTDQAGYRIPARPQDLDLLEFRRLRDEARSADGIFRQALHIAQELDDRNWQFEALHGLGRLHHATYQPEVALADHRQALDLATDLRQPSDQARAHGGVANAYHTLHQTESARHH